MRIITQLTACIRRLSVRTFRAACDAMPVWRTQATATMYRVSAGATVVGVARVVMRTIGLGIFATAFSAMAAQPESPPVSLDNIVSPAMLATPEGVNIPCEETPFGMAAPVVSDYEAMLLLWGASGKYIEEYRPSAGAETPPLQLVDHTDTPTNRTLRKAVSADLNGNGKDEVVEVLSDGSDVIVRVYERLADSNGNPTSFLFSSWSYTEPVAVDSFSIVAGDLEGSKDRRQEIAIAWTVAGTGADSGKTRVVVLQGNAIGQLAQTGTSAPAASFLTNATGLGFPQLVVGDFIAQGRDQLLLTAYAETVGAISLDLLEFDNGSNPATITTALPTLGNSMRGSHFYSDRIDAQISGTHYFNYDDGTHNVVTTDVQGFPVIEAFQANAGDLVDTPADELAVHLMFFDPTASAHVLALGLMHFVADRSDTNVITSISLNILGTNYGFDSRVSVGSYPTPNRPSFAGTVADVDAIAHKEIVSAVAGFPGSFGAPVGPMVWSARKAFVRNHANYAYQNLGLNNGGSPVVAFTDVSHGAIASYAWSFGDGTVSSDESPRHTFASTGIFNVSLTTTDVYGKVSTWGVLINVTSGADANRTITGFNEVTYGIDPTPVFSGDSGASYQYLASLGYANTVKIAVGDMNRDGLPEVAVAVLHFDAGTVDMHVFQRQQDGSFGRTSMSSQAYGVNDIEWLFSDYDGDSLNAVLSGTSGDCRAVVDTTVSSLTWMPPYFKVPQADASRTANFGKSSSTSNSVEEGSESFSSNSFTVWAGVDAEVEVPIVAIKVAEVEAKVKLGAEFQETKGFTTGDEQSYTIDQGFSVGSDAINTEQEGLVVAQHNYLDCYSYNLVGATGIVSGSGLRACGAKPSQKDEYGAGALDWNQAGTNEIPVHWVPMQRDWASLALFHVPQSGTGVGAPMAFAGGHGAANATDGLFDTSAESAVESYEPYLEIDLGYVRDIQSIRVFPSADGEPSASQPLEFKHAVLDLQGFRLYASATPFAGSDLPSIASLNTFVPGGVSTMVQDSGVEAVYRFWNVWTLSAGQPLRARYLRLQKPGYGNIRIAEIQVFGDTHSEPQFYPDAVCDPVAGDGLFNAYVFDNVNRQYRTIQVRGDMVWTGAVDLVGNVLQPTGVPNCVNASSIRQGPIWQGTAIAGSAETSWNLSSDHTLSNSTSHSSEWSVHAGAEFEAKGGAGVQAVVGGEYEYTGGVTTEHQSGVSFSSGFQLGGEIGGLAPLYASTCTYHPRPYNFMVKEYSDAGYLQNMNVTDYVVTQKTFAPSHAWQREAVPARCSDGYSDDVIFVDGLE